MTGRYDVRLNNHSLNELGDALVITDVTEGAPKEKRTTYPMGIRNGTRLLRTTRESLSVGVRFVLREYDTARRTALFNRVLMWARGGGYLEINDRPGQRLYVEDVDIPTLGSVKQWTGEITATLTAYARPFWESAYLLAASIATAGTTGSATLLPPGNAEECFVRADIKAVGGTVNTLTVTVGNTSMAFTSLGLAAGSTLAIGLRDNGTLFIKAGTTSKMDKRTGASADELLLTPGKSGAVSFSANATCTALFRTRGGWK